MIDTSQPFVEFSGIVADLPPNNKNFRAWGTTSREIGFAFNDINACRGGVLFNEDARSTSSIGGASS